MSRHRRSPSAWPLVLSFGALILAGNPSCSDDPSAPEEPSESNVSVESSNRETATIGSSGGSISTTSSAGVTYTLDIPAGAIPGDVEIAITPVTSIENLPYSAGLEGAVRLGPSGLVLLKPAELSIGAIATPGGEQQLIGFSYEGDAETIEPTVAGQVGDEISVLVTHFSGAGAALADPQDLDDSSCENLPPDASLLTSLANCIQGGNSAAFIAFMTSRLDLIRAAIQTSSGDALQEAVASYSEWVGMIYWEDRTQAYMPNAVEGFEDEIVEINELVTSKLVAAMADANAECTPGSTTWLIEFFEFRALGHAVFSEIGIPPALDDSAILDGLCATAVVEYASLVDPLPLNQDRSLDIKFALDVNGTLVDAVFDVLVIDVDNHVQNPHGRTDARGLYTTVVRRLIPEGAMFQISGVLMLPLFDAGPLGGLSIVQIPIRVEEQLFRGGDARMTVVFPSIVPPDTATPLSVQVEQLESNGYQPIDSVLMTFIVDGGTANPSADLTAADGTAITQITPSNGETNVVVDIVASKNGVQLGSKQVAAFVEGGTVNVVSRRSVNWGYQPAEWCTGTGTLPQEDLGTARSNLIANVQETCVDTSYSFEDMYTVTRSRSSLWSLVSDPGVNTGIIMIQCSGTASASVDACTGDATLCADDYWRSGSAGGSGEVYIDFRIDVPTDFEFDGTHRETFNYSTGIRYLTQFTVTRIDVNPGQEQMNWNGLNTGSWDGTLVPGVYRLRYKNEGGFQASWGEGTLTATWNTELTFKLTPAAVARSEAGRM
jgi:hypothetical protein